MQQDKDTSDTSHLPSHVEDEINLLDYLIVLLKRKKLIISITLGAAAIAAIIVFIINTNSYYATIFVSLSPKDIF